ncbi:MAG TPA: hypothetical protein VFD32_07435 [Dehalococcoidia bacterium]|nr:hypothetical protein [Dehalococcoidia bacterium]
MWYTLVRFKDDPQHITGVSQARTPEEALSLMDTWGNAYPDHTTVVFDPKNAPVNRRALADGSAVDRAAVRSS